MEYKHKPIALINAPLITSDLNATIDRLDQEGYIPIVAISHSDKAIVVVPPDTEALIRLLKAEIVTIIREELIRLKETDGGQRE